MERNRDLCRIVMKDNLQYLATPNGDILPMQVWTRVTQVLAERPYAIVKIWVNLDDTVDSEPIAPTFPEPRIDRYP